VTFFFRALGDAGWYIVFCTQKPPMPETVAMHCAKLTKPQFCAPPKAILRAPRIVLRVRRSAEHHHGAKT
jgi:hypothetical protein